MLVQLRLVVIEELQNHLLLLLVERSHKLVERVLQHTESPPHIIKVRAMQVVYDVPDVAAGQFLL